MMEVKDHCSDSLTRLSRCKNNRLSRAASWRIQEDDRPDGLPVSTMGSNCVYVSTTTTGKGKKGVFFLTKKNIKQYTEALLTSLNIAWI